MRETYGFWNTLNVKGESLALEDADLGWRLSYTDLDTRVRALADQLREAPRSLVVLFAKNDIPTITCLLASLSANHVVFLLPASLSSAEVLRTVETYRPEFIVLPADTQVFVSTDFYAARSYRHADTVLVRKRCQDAPPHEALGLVLSTSASTGSPKAVCLPVNGIAAAARQVADALAVTSGDRSLLSLPLSYVYGLSVLSSSLESGAASVLVRGSWADRSFAERVANAKVAAISTVTQTLEYVRAAGMRISAIPTLRRLTHAGGRLDPELFYWVYRELRDSRVGFFLMYGQTEASGRISVLPPRELPDLHRSVGCPVRDGNVSISANGEVVYRGPGVMLGYAYCREDLALGDTLHGVLHTGDGGYVDERGNLFITGRLDRYCKIFGKRVHLDEVEVLFRAQCHCPIAAVEREGSIAVFLEDDGHVATVPVLDIALRLQVPPQSFRVVRLPKLPLTDRGKIAYKTLGAVD